MHTQRWVFLEHALTPALALQPRQPQQQRDLAVAESVRVQNELVSQSEGRVRYEIAFLLADIITRR